MVLFLSEVGDGAFPQGFGVRAHAGLARSFLASVLPSLEGGQQGQLQPNKKGGADIGSFL